MQNMRPSLRVEMECSTLPSPAETALEVAIHTASPRRIPPHILLENGVLQKRGQWHLHTALKVLQFPLVRDVPTDGKVIRELVADNRKISFVADEQAHGLEHALVASRARKKLQVQFLERMIAPSDLFQSPTTNLTITNLSELSGDKLMRGWTDFVRVYGWTRLLGNASRKADSMRVVMERLRHIWDRGLQTDRAQVLVAHLGKTPVGTASLYRMDDGKDVLPRVQFADACVHPAFQHHGIGTTMMEYRLTLARRIGAPILAFSTVYDPGNYSLLYLSKYGFQHWFNVDYFRIPKVA